MVEEYRRSFIHELVEDVSQVKKSEKKKAAKRAKEDESVEAQTNEGVRKRVKIETKDSVKLFEN